MIKVNIMNMNRFLEVVNQCRGCIYSIAADGRKSNITRDYYNQETLEREYAQNGNKLPLTLLFDDHRDYMSVVSYYAGDC